MPLVLDSHDSLPFIDPEPSQESLAAAKALISAEVDPASSSATHPSLPPEHVPKFSPLIEQELARIAAEQPRTDAIDLSRYEVLEPPPRTDPTSDEDRPEILESWRQTLRRAYASSAYLSERLKSLGLLDRFGKNAWLVGNSQLEDVLKAIEAELAVTREQLEETERARRRAQECVKGEMETLEQSWRSGVERMIAAEAAAEGLRREILERRRQAVAA